MFCDGNSFLSFFPPKNSFSFKQKREHYLKYTTRGLFNVFRISVNFAKMVLESFMMISFKEVT